MQADKKVTIITENVAIGASLTRAVRYILPIKHENVCIFPKLHTDQRLDDQVSLIIYFLPLDTAQDIYSDLLRIKRFTRRYVCFSLSDKTYILAMYINSFHSPERRSEILEATNLCVSLKDLFDFIKEAYHDTSISH